MKRKAVKYKLAEEILASVTGEKTKSYVAKAPAFQFLIPCWRVAKFCLKM